MYWQKVVQSARKPKTQVDWALGHFMGRQHPVFNTDVNPDQVIWRYFDLPKFLSLLDKGALYFCRADLLGDPLEGSFTWAREAARRTLLQSPPQGLTSQQLEGIFRHNMQITASTVKYAYVNCWHLGDHESMALWRGYGGGNFGIAIKSTLSILNEILPEKFQNTISGKESDMDAIFIGRVKYLNYVSESDLVPYDNNVYGPFVCKSLAYKFENEVRCVFIDLLQSMSCSEPHAGRYIPINLERLIRNVVVSPLAPSWFQEAVRSLVEKFGYKLTVDKSTVFSKPVY